MARKRMIQAINEAITLEMERDPRVILFGDRERRPVAEGDIALSDDIDLLARVNLLHEHLHYHDGLAHSHSHHSSREHEHDHDPDESHSHVYEERV